MKLFLYVFLSQLLISNEFYLLVTDVALQERRHFSLLCDFLMVATPLKINLSWHFKFFLHVVDL